MELENIIDVKWPVFEDGKYVLNIYYANVDMSVGTYGSDLGTIKKRVEYTNKMKCWGDYKKIKELLNGDK